MKGDKIKYKDGYKYQLHEDYRVQTSIIPKEDIRTPFIELDTTGLLIIRKAYAWDGPSGPTYDTKSFMRGSLVHDAFYQLMRLGLIEQSCRTPVDGMIRDMCIEDGMWDFRAWYVYYAVNIFGKDAAKEGSEREVITAP